MAIKRMLIDSSHAEETRVVVATGTSLDEFDFETSTRKQLKGNIYLAKITRVEPSLQAAFVEYGGNRHGFLPFSEIHPDYYQIPLADREALFREQEAAAKQAEVDEEAAAIKAEAAASSFDRFAPDAAPHGPHGDDHLPEEISGSPEPLPPDEPVEPWNEPGSLPTADNGDAEPQAWSGVDAPSPPHLSRAPIDEGDSGLEPAPPLPGDIEPSGEFDEPDAQPVETRSLDELAEAAPASSVESAQSPGGQDRGAHGSGAGGVEEVGGDEIDDAERRRAHVSRSLLSRRYKIQEVIKKRQIMLVQVVKEERGTKGAALTTYLSLAGRYCVLMPNAIRGGGISRKIVNAEDRRRLKLITSELEVPGRMGLIVRTAGMNRTKAEIKRDFEYLIRQWESIRDLTLQSTAPCLIYGEADLIRRSIRDLYTKEIDEILVEGDEGYRVAKNFMRTLIPSHTSKVQPYRDRVPLFVRYQIESQLDSMYSPQVQLRSGGYLVMNQTEALVAIDVNSGRATKERNIEETAFRTNMEAAEELARQLRLRDLAGLIVIDFIDMDESRNQRAVERRLKESLKSDRARIQVGRISPFGLLEMSRQRLRPSLAEASMETCAACGGTGLLRSTESAALHVLRAIEEEGMRDRASEIRIRVPSRVAMYVLNHKRHALAAIEARYAFLTSFAEDNTLVPPGIEIERIRARGDGPPPDLRALHAVTSEMTAIPAIEDEEIPVEDEAEADASVSEQPEAGSSTETEEQRERGRRRRRRKRGHGIEGGERSGPRREEARSKHVAAHSEMDEAPEPRTAEPGDNAEPREDAAAPAVGEEGEAAGAAPRRRRGRRGGRRRRGRVGPHSEGEVGVAAGPAHDHREQPIVTVIAGAGEIAATDDEAAAQHRERGRRRHRRGGRRRHGEAAEAGTEPRRSHNEGDVYRPTAAPESAPEHVSRPAETSPASDDAPPARTRDEGEVPRRLSVDEMESSTPPRNKVDEPLGDDAGPSGSARRGWWQRVLNSR
ncbi:MAG: Rne/Rng family ribonuclease [Alphaproteobacteria bacterium]|nr:Rne/Rng family ribonuclease [Alphaproteobacteria bacterium]